MRVKPVRTAMIAKVRSSRRGTDRPVTQRQHVVAVIQARATITAAKTLVNSSVAQNSAPGTITAIMRLDKVRLTMSLSPGGSGAEAGPPAVASGAAPVLEERRHSVANPPPGARHPACCAHTDND